MVRSLEVPLRTFVRDTAVSALVLVGLYGLVHGVQFPPLQLPGYLLIVVFDVLEGIFGPAGSEYHQFFAVYLLGLGMIGAAISTILREHARETDLSSWRVGTAGALAVIGVLSMLFGVVVSIGSSQLLPVLITGIAGLGLLLVAGLLAGLVGIRTTPRE